MQKKLLSRKCLRFFKRTFRGGKFNKEYFKEDYKALFSHVYKELNKFGNVEYSSAQVLKDIKEARKLFDILEPYIKAVFEHYGIQYSEEYAFGSMDNKESEKFLKGLIGQNKYKQEKKSERKPDKFVKEIVEEVKRANKVEKQVNKPVNNKEKQDEPLKAEDVIIFHDRKSFETVYHLAKYRFGQPNEKNKKEICQYISKFTLKKDLYLIDAVDETLSDEHGGGGKKKYSVLDKSVWFELNQTFHFYIHVFHLYDYIYYPELYAKEKKEGGLLNYFKKFFGLNDEKTEMKEETTIIPKAREKIELAEVVDNELEMSLKNSVKFNRENELSEIKEIKEPQAEIQPIELNRKK